jgi:hypothetical protein
MGVQPPPAYHVAPRRGHYNPAGSGKEGPGKEDGGPDFPGVFRGDLRGFDIPQTHTVAIRAQGFNPAPEGTVHRKHHLNIFNIGNIPQNYRLVS